jgi:flagellin
MGSSSAVAVGASVAGSGPGQGADSAFAKSAAINAANIQGLTATASNTLDATFTAITDNGAGDQYALSVNGVNVLSGVDASGGITAQQAVDAVNANSSETGVTASLAGSTITFSTADGRNIVLDQTLTDGAADGNAIAGGLADATQRGTVTLSAQTQFTLGGAEEAVAGFTDNQAVALGVETLSDVDVLSVDNANDAMKRVDAALTTVSSLRSTFGAIQNRFESTINNLQAVSENLSASRSRILDADFAAETANLTKAQILQQAGTAILAQANSVPQNVLSLLR